MSNIIYLNDYRKEVLEEETELRNPILLGWDEDDSLYIASTVDTEECLWMIDIAKKIIETRPPDVINNNEWHCSNHKKQYGENR